MTLRASALCALLVGLIAFPALVLADPSTPLSAAWNTYRQAVATLPPDEIVAAARALQAVARETDTVQAPDLSLVMLRDADALRSRGETGTATQIAQISGALSPSLMTPHAWLAQTWLTGPDPDLFASIKEWIVAWKASMSNFWSLLYRIDRLIAAALLSVASAAVLVVAYFIIRTIPLLGHLFVEWSGHRVFRPTAWIMATWILLLPLAVVHWGGWLVLVPGAVVWWFLSARERLTLGVLAVLGVAVSLLLPYTIPLLTADHSDELRLLVDVADGRSAAGPLAAAVIAESPQGAAARGIALVRGDRIDEAATLFEEALVRWPGDPRLLTGYGNLFFHRHEYDRAIQQYEQALHSVPQSIPVLYNLSQAYRADLRFEEGETRYQEARAIDAGVLDRYAERSRRGEAFLVMDYPTTHKELLVAAFEPRPLSPVLHGAIEEISRHVAPFVTVGVLTLFSGCWVVGRWLPNQAASPCVACGTAVCPHCQRYFLDSKLCPSCWKTHAKGAKFTAQALPQVLRHWEVRRRVAALLSLVPGVGHFSIGRPLWGLFIALIGWGLIWIGLLERVSWNTTEIRLVPLPWYTTWAPIAVGLTVLLLIGARHLLSLDWTSMDSELPQERS